MDIRQNSTGNWDRNALMFWYIYSPRGSEVFLQTDNHCECYSHPFLFTLGKSDFKHHCVALKERRIACAFLKMCCEVEEWFLFAWDTCGTEFFFSLLSAFGKKKKSTPLILDKDDALVIVSLSTLPTIEGRKRRHKPINIAINQNV